MLDRGGTRRQLFQYLYRVYSTLYEIGKSRLLSGPCGRPILFGRYCRKFGLDWDGDSCRALQEASGSHDNPVVIVSISKHIVLTTYIHFCRNSQDLGNVEHCSSAKHIFFHHSMSTKFRTNVKLAKIHQTASWRRQVSLLMDSEYIPAPR